MLEHFVGLALKGLLHLMPSFSIKHQRTSVKISTIATIITLMVIIIKIIIITIIIIIIIIIIIVTTTTK